MSIFRAKLARLGCTVATAAILVASGSAQAQEKTDETEAGSGLNIIVVTAQKREQDLQDVSASVQALAGEDLTRAGIVDVSRLEQLAPGIVFAKGGNDAKIALRGANSNSTFADNTSIVGFFVDGVYKPRSSQQSRAFFDVARLEVLRGPQGTLYGRNTLGGAINLYSKNADVNEPGISGGLDSQYSRFNRLRNEFYVNAGISDEFAIRFAGMTDHSDGWVENLIGRNLGISKTLAGRLSITAKPSDDVDFNLKITHVNDDGNPAGMFAIQGACRTVTANGLTDPFGTNFDCQNPRRGSGGTPDFDKIDGVPGVSNKDLRTVERDFVHDDRLRETNITLETNVDLGAVAMKSITSYTNYVSLLGNDSDYSRNPHGREWVEENNESFTQELQFLSQWDGPLQMTVGAYASYDKLFFAYSSLRHTVDNTAARVNVLSANGVLLPVLSGTPLVSLANNINGTFNSTQFIDSRYLGVFGEATFSLTDSLRVTGGIRYNNEKKDALNANAAYSGSLTPVQPPSSPQEVFRYKSTTATGVTDVSETFKNTTWRAAVEYDVSDDILLYGTAATGFLSGVMNQNGSVTQPQKSMSYEIGFKSRFWEDRAQVNLALYDVKYKQLATTFQIPNPNDPGAFITLSSNGGVLNAKGAELSVSLLPTDAWNISFAASYLDAEYGRFGQNLPGGFQVINGIVPASRFIDLRGQRPPYTPEFTFTLGSSYDIDLGFGKLTPAVQFRYSDSYFAHGGLPFDLSGFQKSFTQTDLRVTFEPDSEKWLVSAYVENIENEMLNQRTQTGGDGLQQANYGLPTNYGVRLKFNF